jgi:hypothetical protein
VVPAAGVLGEPLGAELGPGTAHTSPPGPTLVLVPESATEVTGRPVISAPTAVTIAVHR